MGVLEARPIYAVIPAAGASRRMGRSKLMMKLRGRPVIEWVIDAVLDGGATGVAVVARKPIEAYLAGRRDTRVVIVRNDRANTEMIDSIRLGLDAWRLRVKSVSACGFLVCPADLPNLLCEDVRACIDAYHRDPRAIVVGRHGGQRGHPILFPGEYWNDVFGSECSKGLHGLLRAHPDQVAETETPSDGSLCDVDTLEDFERMNAQDDNRE